MPGGAQKVKAVTHFVITSYSIHYTKLYESIPYEPGWNITVDGEKVEPTVLLNSLIGIEVPEGTHKVTMEFFPDYFKKGIILSLTGLLVLIVILIIDKRNKSKEVLLKKLYN